jgi:hypothetical protein
MTTQDSHPTADTPGASESADVPAPDTEAATVPDVPSEPVSSTNEDEKTATAEEQLVSQEAAMDFKARWEAIQQGFVDDPRSAVSDADSLVSDVLQKLSSSFEEQHRQLESQWSDGEPDTEELRSAFQRYRDFFDRLLAI